jgi:flagellar assembly protein FliH
MTAVKFTFGTSFGDGDASQPAGQSRARKSANAAEIEAIRAAAFEEGRNAGEVRATEAMAASLSEFAASLNRAVEKMNTEVEGMRAEAAQLAVAAAKKLAGAALAHAPEAEIAEALRVALQQAISETHITIKAPPGLVQGLHEKLAEIARHEAFEGRLRFVPDPKLHFGDWRIEWRGGGIERAQSKIEEGLNELITRRFPPPDEE